jgi:hypothetical protein
MDRVKRNIKQPRNLISREAGFRLNAGLFAEVRHVNRSDCAGLAIWIRTRPHHRHMSIVWLSRLALARTVSEFPGCRVAYLGHEGFRSIDNRFKQLAGHYALRVAGFGQILETFSNEVLSGASIIGR